MSLPPVDSATPEIAAEFGSAESAEAQRRKLRELCLASTYAFATLVYRFQDLSKALHGDMCAWIDNPRASYNRRLGVSPRAHLKTSCWTEAYNLRMATRDPTERICISNETVNLPVKWIASMQAVILSPTYRWLFPEVVPDPEKVRWNSQQIELQRPQKFPQPTIEGIGVGGAKTGNHYSRVHEDDLVGEEAYYSPIAMERAIDHHKLGESLLIDPAKNPIVTVGTRWGVNDVIDWMLRNEHDLDVFFLSCWKPDGTPIWPERFTPEYLKRLRIKYGPALFALQYENRVVSGGANEWDAKLLKRWTWKPNCKEPTLVLIDGESRREVPLHRTNRFQLLDCGVSPESEDARTANVVVAITPPTPTRPHDVVVLEARADKVDPAGAIDAAWEVFRKWDPICCAVEVFAAHETIFRWIPTAYPEMRVRRLKTDTHKGKLTRIREFYPWIQQGRVYIHDSHADLIEEVESFPRGRTVDLVDALAYAPSIWGAPEMERTRNRLPPGVTAFDIEDRDPMEFVGPGMQGWMKSTGY